MVPDVREVSHMGRSSCSLLEMTVTSQQVGLQLSTVLLFA